MTKKSLLVVVLFVVMIVLGKSIFAQYDNLGDWATEEGYDSEEDITIGVTSTGAEEYSTEIEEKYDPILRPGFSLYMEMRMYCHDAERDEATEKKFVSNDLFTKYGHLFIDDYLDYYEYGALLPFLPYTSAFSFNPDLYSWVFEETDDDYYTWTQPERLYLPFTLDNPFDNAKLHRFEGTNDGNEDSPWENYGCIPYLALFNTVNFTNQESWIAFEWDGDVKTPLDPSITPTYNKNIGDNINWDSDQDDCEAIGGAWSEDASLSGYRCCGDDSMWLNNRAVNQRDGFEKPIVDYDDLEALDKEEVTMNSFCLYGTGDLDDPENNEISYEAIRTDDSYTCSQTDFDAYDDALHLDDDYDDGLIELNKETPFIFQGIEAETDIGKWSDVSGQNPQICSYAYEFSETGEKYEWLDVNTAADATGPNGYPLTILGEEVTDVYKDPETRLLTLCEEYLGSTWTGSHCCGNKYDYEDVATKGYDSDTKEEYVDESYSETTPIYYDEAHTQIKYQYACAEGKAITVGETATVTGDDGKEYKLLNNASINGGTLYGCNIGTLSLVGKDWYTQRNLITADTNANPCAKQGSYLCNYNYTDPANPQWEWYSLTTGDLEGKYVKDVLGYSSSTDRFAHSQPAWATAEQQPEACCAGNRCWNGGECVDEHTPYDYDTDADGEEEHYLCSEGQWTGELETKYDWYYNTDGAAINYCPESYSCVCSSNEDDETFCTANDAYVEGGCTLEQDFYTKDHFCEAYTNTDGIDSSRWTSRTKLLAFQLMDIAEAEATDYTLFCDNYTNSLNTWVTVEPIAEDINSFCVLSQNDEITIGVTFNSDDEDEPMTVDVEKLLFGTNGFLSNILDVEDMEDREDCDAALAEDQSTYRFGKYYSCDGKTKKIFYNSKLKALIYSKDRTGATTLAYPTDDFTSYQTSFDDYRQTILDHLASETIENPAGDPLIEDFASFEHVQDYNRIYYAEDSGTSVFGFEDLKYDGETGNRWYLGVVYDGITIDCDQIYAPYETTLKIYCSSDAGIVLERSTTGSEYWNSLTAALRLE